eukprot:gb/GECG01009030.1/.p1 GENE.gb/GECG01009030.1/~~gb/GECG01009030.1/.p1  ORF type:complete len:420 (+),score=57.35 gb/GECG01009030.1/:1-1260(+)
MASSGGDGTSGNLRRVNGQVLVPVYLLDNSMKQLLVDEWATAKSIIDQMMVKLNIQNSEVLGPCFSIHQVLDGVTIGRALRSDEPIIPIMQAWGNNKKARLVFRIQLFMESIMDSDQNAIIYLLYIQSVYNVITGIYPCSMDDAVSLASLQVQYRYGNHDPNVHKAGYLTHQLKGLIPAPVLGHKAASQWEKEILERHNVLNEDARKKPKKLYSEILRTRDYFGCEFFPVYAMQKELKKHYPEHFFLGINLSGIFFFDKDTKDTLDRFPLARIYRWGYHPEKSFYFEMKASKDRRSGMYYEVSTTEGSIICDVLTDYAQQLLVELKHKKSKGQQNENSYTSEHNDKEINKAMERSEETKKSSREEHAATRMQALYRGYKLRDHLQRKYAAIRIQALVRGYLARCRFEQMIEELEEEYGD